MYTMHLKGINESVEIDSDDYETFLEAQKDGNVDRIELSCGSFRVIEIKAIVKSAGTERYDRTQDNDTQRLKEIMGGFEEEWDRSMALHPGTNSEYGRIFFNGELQLMLKYGAITLEKDKGTYRIVASKIKEWSEKKDAMEELRSRRLYAKKQEHLDTLAGDECLKKPGAKGRCELCYPITLKEVVGREPAVKTI